MVFCLKPVETKMDGLNLVFVHQGSLQLLLQLGTQTDGFSMDLIPLPAMLHLLPL